MIKEGTMILEIVDRDNMGMVFGLMDVTSLLCWNNPHKILLFTMGHIKTIKKYNVAKFFMQNNFAETNLEEQNDHILPSWNNNFKES